MSRLRMMQVWVATVVLGIGVARLPLSASEGVAGGGIVLSFAL
jgi:hypothetical protein